MKKIQTAKTIALAFFLLCSSFTSAQYFDLNGTELSSVSFKIGGHISHGSIAETIWNVLQVNEKKVDELQIKQGEAFVCSKKNGVLGYVECLIDARVEKSATTLFGIVVENRMKRVDDKKIEVKKVLVVDGGTRLWVTENIDDSRSKKVKCIDYKTSPIFGMDDEGSDARKCEFEIDTHIRHI